MDGAKRIINAIKALNNANKDATSDIVSLTVQSTDPLVFQNENRLNIDQNFYALSKVENWNGLKKGDIVRAFKMNNGQSYYINEILSGEGGSDNIKNLEEALGIVIDQLQILSEDVKQLKQDVKNLDARVKALENRG